MEVPFSFKGSKLLKKDKSPVSSYFVIFPFSLGSFVPCFFVDVDRFNVKMFFLFLKDLLSFLGIFSGRRPKPAAFWLSERDVPFFSLPFRFSLFRLTALGSLSPLLQIKHQIRKHLVLAICFPNPSSLRERDIARRKSRIGNTPSLRDSGFAVSPPTTWLSFSFQTSVAQLRIFFWPVIGFIFFFRLRLPPSSKEETALASFLSSLNCFSF